MRLFRVFIITTAFSVFLCGAGLAAEFGPIEMHGFISQGYLQSSANDYLVKSEKGSFEFNEVGINFTTNPTEKLRLGVQLMARDLGDAGNNEVVVDWAFADYRLSNELGIRLGKLKIPMGLYNESRDTDVLRTWILLPQSVYTESWRDFVVACEGGGVYGTIDADSVGRIEYKDVFGTIGRFDSDQVNLGKQVESFMQPLAFTGEVLTAEDFEVTGRTFNSLQLIWNTPLEGLRFGSTWIFGKLTFDAPAMTQMTIPYPARSVDLKMARLMAYSGEFKWNNLTMAAEYIEEKLKINYGMDTPAAMQAVGLEMPDGRTILGYYGSLTYRFTDWLELGTYYSVYYPNKDDKQGDDLVADATKAALITGSVDAVDFQAWQKDTCVTARFDINPAWCIKLEGHHMNGTAQVYDYASVDDLAKIWSLYAVKTSFSF